MKRFFKKLFLGALLILYSSDVLALPQDAQSKVSKIFLHENACFILKKENAKKPEVALGGKLCTISLSLNHQVLMPVVLLSSEKGLIQDAKTLFKWDGVKHSNSKWNKDQFVTSWIENRVEWVTNRILTQVGKSQADRFFLSLGFPENPNAENLLLFSKNFFSAPIPVKSQALDFSRQLFYIGKFRFGTEVWGEKAESSDWALFLGQVAAQGDRYHLATLLKPSNKSQEPISAERAQALSMDALTELGLF